jgi:hypothetical protein
MLRLKFRIIRVPRNADGLGVAERIAQATDPFCRQEAFAALLAEFFNAFRRVEIPVYMPGARRPGIH